MTDLPFYRKLNIKFLGILMAAVLLLAAGAYFIHGIQVRRNASALLDLADRSEKASEFSKTAEYLNRYLQLNPKDAEAQARLALLLSDDKKLAKSPQNLQRAFDSLELALRLSPERHDLRRRMVDLAMNLHSYKNAAPHLTQLLIAFPHEPALLAQRAKCYEMSGDFKNARDKYTEAIATAPLVAQYYADLAYLLHKHPREAMKNERTPEVVLELADNKIDEMVRINERSPEARLLRVQYIKDFQTSLSTSELMQKTEPDIRKAYELKPDTADVLVAVAGLEQEKKAPEKALACLRRGIHLYPDDWRMYRDLARLEYLEGHADAAIQCLQDGLKHLPHDIDIIWHLCLLLIEGNRAEEARPLIDKLHAEGRPDTDLDYLKACILFQQGKWIETVRILQRVYTPLMDRHQQNPDWFAFNYALKASLTIGYCYEQIGEPERASAAYGRVALRDAHSKAAHRGLARMEWGLGRLDTAILEYRKLLALPDAPPEAWTELAQVLLQRNLQRKTSDWSEVAKVLDAADKLVPRPPEVSLLRADILRIQQQVPQAQELLAQDYPDKKSRPAAIWVAMASLEEQQGHDEAAMTLLQDAERYGGDCVDLRLAKASYWVRQELAARQASSKGSDPSRPGKANRQATEVARLLAALAGDTSKFKSDQRRQLIQGLATSYRQIGDNAAAARFWQQLADEQTNDLTSRMNLFDIALADRVRKGLDDGLMSRYIAEIRNIEGDEGTLWRYLRACQLIENAAQPLRKLSAEKRRELARSQHEIKSTLKEASDLLDIAVNQRPRWPRVLVCQGQVQELLGNPEGAITKFQQAVLLGERDLAVIRHVVEMLSDRQRYAEADQMLQALGERTAPLAGMERAAAEVALAYKHDAPTAVRLAEKAVSADSKEFRDHLWLGQMLWAARQPAEPSFRRAVALAPQEPTAWIGLVNYLLRTNKKADAEKTIREAESSLPQAKKALALAQCYSLLGDNDRALKLYQEALETQPNDLDVLRGVAVYQLKQNHLKEAVRYLRQIVDRQADKPDQSAWARNMLALVLTAEGSARERQEALALLGIVDRAGGTETGTGGGVADERTRAQVLASQPGLRPRQEAIKILEKMRQERKASSADRLLLASLYEACGAWPKARDEMVNLAATEEQDLANASPELRGELQAVCTAYFGRFAYRMLAHDEVGQAQSFLEKLEQLQPDAFATLALKARILARSSRAAEIKDDILDRARRKADLVEPAAGLLEEIGQTAEAEELFKRFVDQSKKPGAVLVLARFYGRQKQPDKALALCAGARKDCSPATVCLAATMVLAASQPTKEQCQLVASWLQEALAKAPTDKKLLQELALVRSRQEDYAGMIQLYRSILAQDPNDTTALNNLAWLQALQEGNAVEALKNIQKAIALDGPLPNRLSTRAVIYLQMGQSQDALKDLEEVLATDPGPLAYFRKAQALHQAHQRAIAVRTLQQAKGLGLKEAMLDPLERRTFEKLNRELGNP